ncbi:hypothetical protein B0T11DRAFT_86325 [Plectosphaerella cucumerina]|uniref:Uncharacterized protein n=1 Tax=Plectosphaerella cucumerina TaxID=40658 RepID=A0A8K0THK7_9PEZI|nr:hypothetical protein B0T11DRAFT_86325 [Plectosphaerella cucumerina]
MPSSWPRPSTSILSPLQHHVSQAFNLSASVLFGPSAHHTTMTHLDGLHCVESVVILLDNLSTEPEEYDLRKIPDATMLALWPPVNPSIPPPVRRRLAADRPLKPPRIAFNRGKPAWHGQRKPQRLAGGSFSCGLLSDRAHEVRQICRSWPTKHLTR